MENGQPTSNVKGERAPYIRLSFSSIYIPNVLFRFFPSIPCFALTDRPPLPVFSFPRVPSCDPHIAPALLGPPY